MFVWISVIIRLCVIGLDIVFVGDIILVIDIVCILLLVCICIVEDNLN